jgi:hypothetical protein
VGCLAAVLPVACRQPAPVAAVASTVKPNEIAWFKGTMEQALGAAQQQDKPLLVYWGGAVWCPFQLFLRKHITKKSGALPNFCIERGLTSTQQVAEIPHLTSAASAPHPIYFPGTIEVAMIPSLRN